VAGVTFGFVTGFRRPVAGAGVCGLVVVGFGLAVTVGFGIEVAASAFTSASTRARAFISVRALASAAETNPFGFATPRATGATASVR